MITRPIDELNISKYESQTFLTINRGDKYLGDGASATVYKKELNGKTIACKFIYPKKNQHALQELCIFALINETAPDNDCFLKLLSFSRQDNEVQLHLEYIDGGSLIEFIDDDTRNHPSTSLNIIHQVAKGLKLLDELNIVHCDIKLYNILLTQEGKAKICDFDLARSKTELAGMSVVRGTLKYLAPEIIAYAATYDPIGKKNQEENNPPLNSNHKTDIYAFGLVIWEILMPYKLLLGKVTELDLPAHIKDPKNLPTHTITAADPLAKQKMASLYKWCCMFDPTLRPNAADIVQECELGEVISDKLIPFLPK